MGLKDRRQDEHVDLAEPMAGDTQIERFRRRLLHEADLEQLSTLNAVQLRRRLEAIAGDLLTREQVVIPREERQVLIKSIIDEMLGLGVLEPLLDDPSVTEIMVNGHDDVWVERDGRLERIEDRAFTSETQLYKTIERIVSAVNRRVDESSPMVDARLPTGERVNVIIPPLSLRGPALTIRRFPRPYSLDELAANDTLSGPLRHLGEALVEARCNVVVSGGTGTGKTTLLNALSGCIPATERIVTIEDAAELQLQQPHVLPLESRPPNVEGRGAITIRDLLRNSLRMRPDRIIIGEVRGDETLDMLQAMNTGHEGSLVTVHANSPRHAVMRLETLASMSELNLSFQALRDQINGAIEVMLHLDRMHDGSRRVTRAAVVVSEHWEPIRLQTIAEFAADPHRSEEVVTGTWHHHGLPPWLTERLHFRGQQVPEAFRTAPATGEQVEVVDDTELG